MIPDLIAAPTRAGAMQRAIRSVQDTEHQFLAHRPRRDNVYNPWMPFQPGEFLSIMFEVVAEVNGRAFLDIGCGPGSKLTLAREFFGLDATGIEVDAAMARVASVHHPVTICDALAFPGYGDFDVLWLYRPFSDPHLEHGLEQQVMADMKTGAILAGGHWEMECPPPDWITIVDDWDNGHRGAWMKPGI